MLGFGPVSFPVFEGGDDNIGVFGVGVVDSFRVVAEGLLGEALRIAASQGTLRPGVAVGVEGYAFYVQAFAALLEFGGAVAGANRAEVWE